MTVSEVKQRSNVYLTAFERMERDLAQVGPPAIQRLRRAAAAQFAELGFPGPRDEEWRFTPLTPILQGLFEPVPEEKTSLAGGRSATGERSLPRGAHVCRLAEALVKHPDLVEPYLAHHADWKTHPFTALNTAFLRDGAFVYIPPGTVIEEPILIDFLAEPVGDHDVWHRRTLIVCGENSQVTLVENYKGLPDIRYFTNAVTEVVLGKNAVVDHYKILEESDAAFHMATMQVQLDRSSTFSSHAVTLSGAWVRNEVNAVFGGEGGLCTLNGLYQASGQQMIDNHTMIDHAYPHCASHELYKGILDGKARGVFNGKIQVRQDAQKTDAKQTNQTLLLSDDATINSKPQLEIYADDVKCTHGATVGQLDEESLFYLRSRGIGLEQARALLTFAFANDVIDRIKIVPLRERLEKIFLSAQHLPQTASLEEES